MATRLTNQWVCVPLLGAALGVFQFVILVLGSPWWTLVIIVLSWPILALAYSLRFPFRPSFFVAIVFFALGASGGHTWDLVQRAARDADAVPLGAFLALWVFYVIWSSAFATPGLLIGSLIRRYLRHGIDELEEPVLATNATEIDHLLAAKRRRESKPLESSSP